MKQIKINYCNDCPYCGKQYPGYACSKASLRVISSKFEENCITIPDWCPLPNVEENFWEKLSNEFYESKLAHDYKDGKIDYRIIHQWFVSHK